MKSLYIIILATSWATNALSQAPPGNPRTTGNAKTTGYCSPAVTGSATVTVNCQGVSGKKAEDLIRLMNQILERRLDPSEVGAQLDRIATEIGMLKMAVDPVAGAPEADRLLLTEADHHLRSCSAFLDDWNAEFNSAATAQLKDADGYRKQSEGAYAEVFAASAQASNSVNKEYSAKFKTSLGPKLFALANQLPASRLKQTTVASLGSIENSTLLGVRCTALQRLTNQAGQTNASTDVLFQECQRFSQEWMGATMARVREVSTKSAQANSMTAGMDAVGKGRSLSYRAGLAPQLVAWQKKMLSRSPTLSSTKDYAPVESSVDLQAICTDIGNLGTAYREMLVAEVRKGR